MIVRSLKAHGIATEMLSTSEHDRPVHVRTDRPDFKAARKSIRGSSNPNLRPAYHTAITESCCYCVPPFPAQDSDSRDAQA